MEPILLKQSEFAFRQKSEVFAVSGISVLGRHSDAMQRIEHKLNDELSVGPTLSCTTLIGEFQKNSPTIIRFKIEYHQKLEQLSSFFIHQASDDRKKTPKNT